MGEKRLALSINTFICVATTDTWWFPTVSAISCRLPLFWSPYIYCDDLIVVIFFYKVIASIFTFQYLMFFIRIIEIATKQSDLRNSVMGIGGEYPSASYVSPDPAIGIYLIKVAVFRDTLLPGTYTGDWSYVLLYCTKDSEFPGFYKYMNIHKMIKILFIRKPSFH